LLLLLLLLLLEELETLTFNGLVEVSFSSATSSIFRFFCCAEEEEEEEEEQLCFEEKVAILDDIAICFGGIRK
jgi:hypothetical protein